MDSAAAGPAANPPASADAATIYPASIPTAAIPAAFPATTVLPVAFTATSAAVPVTTAALSATAAAVAAAAVAVAAAAVALAAAAATGGVHVPRGAIEHAGALCLPARSKDGWHLSLGGPCADHLRALRQRHLLADAHQRAVHERRVP